MGSHVHCPDVLPSFDQKQLKGEEGLFHQILPGHSLAMRGVMARNKGRNLKSGLLVLRCNMVSDQGTTAKGNQEDAACWLTHWPVHANLTFLYSLGFALSTMGRVLLHQRPIKKTLQHRCGHYPIRLRDFLSCGFFFPCPVNNKKKMSQDIRNSSHFRQFLLQ